MNGHMASQYRALAARANYLAPDRPGIQFVTKELCRDMSEPKGRSWTAMKRLGRYLQSHPRHVQEYRRQGRQGDITTWVEPEYVGCVRTRPSTSGGALCLGKHVINTWSSTQKVIALSVGEAYYYGVVKGTAMGKGTQSLIKGFWG